ncbi:MAG: spermidine/putrescine ABC transporter substrate-binding protein [Oscillospiraceae bacterium]|jgi:spermidine/putrescine-binding protein|nr:spermidine/putrescine ABC transporter substrate-binding protein [Oscillospiraceae bacterium]
MKKTIRTVATALTLALLLAVTAGLTAGCSAKEVVQVFNWGEYIDESIFADFKAQTGITVKYSTFETNEDLYAKLKAGGASYDVIIPSDYMVARMIEEGMLEKIDFANVPNASLISERYQKPYYDPTGEYSAAYMWGTVGLIYNPELVSGEVTSWGTMFDPAYSGQILMFDNSRDAFGIALKYLGYSLNTTDKTQLAEALELLKTQKSILQGYVMDTIFDKMEGGEAAIGAYYAGDYLSMLENNENLRFVLPSEGANIFSDALCIPKGAKNKANGEAFINFVTSTEIALRNMDVTGYVSGNQEAADEFAADLDDETFDIMFPNDEILARCEPFYNLPADIRNLYDDMWNELLG